MTTKFAPLDFEKSIYEIEDKIEELKTLSGDTGIDLQDQISTLTKQANEYKQQLYSILHRLKVTIARHSKGQLSGLCLNDCY